MSRTRLSWTRIILSINTFLFALLTFKSMDLFNPTIEDLILFGAKDPYLLAQGEWWRLVTPIFVHVGILHFFLNNAGLNYIGPFFERLLGPRWFLGTYLGTGIIGNIASSLTHLSIGAGASGALFGLVGVGMVVEWRSYSRRGVFALLGEFTLHPRILLQQLGQLLRIVRTMPFTWIAILNLLIALAFNALISLGEGSIAIDNAAHLGGMGGGIALGLAFIWTAPREPLSSRKRLAGITLLILTLLSIIVGALVVCT